MKYGIKEVRWTASRTKHESSVNKSKKVSLTQASPFAVWMFTSHLANVLMRSMSFTYCKHTVPFAQENPSFLENWQKNGLSKLSRTL